MSHWRLLRPLTILAVLVSLFCALLSVQVVPASLATFREQVTKVRADVVSFVAQPGRFVNLSQGLVFHVRERAPNGVMRGIFINDAREKEVSTYLADRGQIVENGAGIFLVLESGSIHRRGGDKANSSSVVEFQRYAFDLSSLAPDSKGQDIKPVERPLAYVLNPPASDMYVRFFPGRYREELHKRLSAGLYPMAFFAIAACALARPRTTRQSRGAALTAIIPAMGLVQIGNFAIAGQLKTQAWAVPLIYALPLATILVCALVLQGVIRISPPQALSNLAEDIRQRFARRAAASS